MKQLIERLIAKLWNPVTSRRFGGGAPGLFLGMAVFENEATNRRVTIPQTRRAEHIAILGKTGQGKSRLLWSLAQQTFEGNKGLIYFDIHGDATPVLVAMIAALEKATGHDLSEKLIIIDPADPEFSVGLNPLAQHNGGERFVQVAELAQLLKQRWHLESFGARTDELLRNSLYVLAEKGLTLLELGPFLSHMAFRTSCLSNLSNPEVKQYFELRYDQASEPMRAVMREPILNKVSAFTADPRFRHIIGQQHSTFSVLDAMDQARWIVLNLHKGKLGEQAATLGSLFLSTIKNSLFARKNRELVSVFCDEIQNLVAYGNGLETILSEARKFGVGIVAANQFLDQHPPEMRAALMAIGTHIFFQLSSPDAQQISTALDGGKSLTELLKNLPRRHMVVKTGHERWQEALVPQVQEPKVGISDLYNRCRTCWARKRTEIEQEIAKRQSVFSRGEKEALNDWE